MTLRAKSLIEILWGVGETGEVKAKVQALGLPQALRHPCVWRLSRAAGKEPENQQPAPNS